MARYVVIEFEPVELREKIINSIINTFNNLTGVYSIKGSLVLVKVENSRAIFRVSTKLLKFLRLTILLLREIDGVKIAVTIVRVSGTLRKAIAHMKSIPKIFY